MKYWYLIYTKPNQEEVAKQHLERQAYEVYLPMSLSRRKKRGKVMKLIDVMFPRYLFIHLDDTSEDWGPIRSTIGVSTLVHFGSSPAKIPEKLITALRSRENNEGVHDLLARTFKEGEKVLIWGKDNQNHIPVEIIAEDIGLNPYNLFTSISDKRATKIIK